MNILPSETIQNISKVIFLHTVDNFNHLYAHLEYKDQKEDIETACAAAGFSTKLVETEHADLLHIDHENKETLQSLIDYLELLNDKDI